MASVSESLDARYESDDTTCDLDAIGASWLPNKFNRAARQQHAARRRPPRESELGAGGARVRPAARRQRPNQPEEFRCRHCRAFVVAVPSGGRHRNHCPACLHSRHVDERLPGDRASPCGATMAPIGAFVRANGEHTLVHRCLDCGIVRHNRIAADDDFALVLALPDTTQPALVAHEHKQARRLKQEGRTSA